MICSEASCCLTLTMNNLRKKLLRQANLLGQKLPKSLLRFIVDFPGVLKLLERASYGEMQEILTPEGQHVVINPLFHANLIHSGGLEDYEPVIRKSILQLTRPGMTAYDIGANVGVFSFLFASIVNSHGVVYAFEPERNNYMCLDKSIKINDCKNIVLDKRAVGTSCGKEQFDRRGGAFSGRLIGNNVSYNKTHNIESVETVSLDYLIKEEKYRAPDIIKIDVEGNEGLVIEGMKHILDHYRPVLICELHTHLGESGIKIIETLIAHGYCVTDAANGSLLAHANAQNTGVPAHVIAVKN